MFIMLCIDDIRVRQGVSEMERVELEDKHLRLLEENFVGSNQSHLKVPDLTLSSSLGAEEARSVPGGENEENGHKVAETDCRREERSKKRRPHTHRLV